MKIQLVRLGFWLAILCALASAAQGHAGEYYTYHDPARKQRRRTRWQSS